MRIRLVAMTLGAVTLALTVPRLAQAALAPGLFGGDPPAGQVMPDNSLTLPQGVPQGFVLLIHGGGWVFTGPATLAAEAPTVRRLTGLGWGVYNVDYRAGWLSVVDVVAAFDHLRALHPGVPLCAYGESAGGQLAMLLAASRPSLRCVVSVAGLSDLTAVPASASLHTLMVHVFHGMLWEFSPVRLASRIQGRLLCVGS